MDIGAQLNAAVGKNIDAICPNKFHHADHNHCAHFVSHVCNVTFSYHCREFKGGSKPGANIRVHELFAQCPKVGRWKDADTSRTQLIFVTLDRNVDVASKEMVNIPQKHVGIYHKNKVYHYGNTNDKVTDTPDTFFQKFEQIYAGKQGLFFGHIPGEDLLLNVKQRGESVRSDQKFELPDPVGGLWKSRRVGDEDFFMVGREVSQPTKNYFGLYVPTTEYWGPIYKAEDYRQELDHWALLLEVSGACESENRFVLVNTYDRAKFTFGFYQLAAHTPRDNLILLFKRLARLEAFKSYFPELDVRDGKLVRVDPNGSATNLEQELQASNGEMQIMLFMNYLNPARKAIDPQEALQAARLIHWTVNHPDARRRKFRLRRVSCRRRWRSAMRPSLGWTAPRTRSAPSSPISFTKGGLISQRSRRSLAPRSPSRRC